MLIAAYGDGGGGWTSYGWFGGPGGPWVIGGAQPSGRDGNVRAAYGLQFGGACFCAYNNNDGPDLDYAESSTPGSLVQRTVPATPDHTALRVIFIGTTTGVLRWHVNGDGWTERAIQGVTTAIQYFDIALTTGVHDIEIEVVSGTVRLCGDNALSDAPGVRVHKPGGSGLNIAQWTARDEANQRTGWQQFDVDTWIVMDGTNTQTAVMARPMPSRGVLTRRNLHRLSC